jgi:two-component system, NtrC family, sensor kinase
VLGAHHGPIPLDFVKWRITRGWTAGRAVVDRKPVHSQYLTAVGSEFPEGHAIAVRQGFKTILSVPLLREGEAIGCLSMRRMEAQPFSAKQIELAETYADQAVIAIENARLFEAEQQRRQELTKALEQQTATADVLKVISRSTFDLQPVLNTLVESATRLCGAPHGLIFRYDGHHCRAVAAYNNVSGFKELWEENPIAPSRATATGRAILERRVVHIPDVLTDEEYNPPDGALKQAQKLGQYRTVVVVPSCASGRAGVNGGLGKGLGHNRMGSTIGPEIR